MDIPRKNLDLTGKEDISVALDGTVEDEKLKFLVDMSYELTRK